MNPGATRALAAVAGDESRVEHVGQFRAAKADIGEFAVAELAQLVQRGLPVEPLDDAGIQARLADCERRRSAPGS
ncbi:MAG: hypothetical protein WDN49_21725 [Acetobacteraceae bacterium]